MRRGESNKTPTDICDPDYETPGSITISARSAHNLALACIAMRNRLDDAAEDDPLDFRDAATREWLDYGARILFYKPVKWEDRDV